MISKAPDCRSRLSSSFICILHVRNTCHKVSQCGRHQGLSILCSLLNPEGANAPCQVSLPFPEGKHTTGAGTRLTIIVYKGTRCHSPGNGHSTIHACQSVPNCGSCLLNWECLHTTLRSSQFLQAEFNAPRCTIYGMEGHFTHKTESP